MVDEQNSPFDEALNIDSLSVEDLEADLLRLQAEPAEAASTPDALAAFGNIDGITGIDAIASALDGPSDGLEALTGIGGSAGGNAGGNIGGRSGANADDIAAHVNPTAKLGGLFAGLAATMGQAPAKLRKNRWVTYGLAFLLLIPLAVGLVWGLNRAWDHYMTPPEAYPPERLAEYTQSAKVVRLHMQGGFERLGQAITLNDKHLIEQALTDSSPRRHDAEQAISDWQGFFSQYRQFEKPAFDIRVFLVRDVEIAPEQNIVEAVADVSTYSSYQVNNRRLERSVDYELWVRLVYLDGHWRLDDYRNVGEGTAGHAGAGTKVSSDVDRLDRNLLQGGSRSNAANRIAVAPARPASRLFGPLPADLGSSLQ
ncbi:hypothetical protein GTO91_07830 [Heliobacterium undosum]|uniref:Uncharacterized protein n=1 Tax=Heliomicrobium undosum TaxID=121734 RepID=A0A845KZP5_9FIRM|nr:hypothetical protein [Heliomicrobium undosum]MZP29612.1 hypothetical protein [Heliomicrobium undosum]